MGMTSFRYRLRLAFLASALAAAGCDGAQSGEAGANAGEITIALPPATPLENAGEAAEPAEVTNTAAPAPAIEDAPPAAAPPEPEEKEDPAPPAEAAADAAPEPAPTEAATQPAPAGTEPAGGAAAPLPAATMASTIRRIGYPCPSVVSSEAAGAAYRITCSSGDVYRGSPRNGRFYFRPWSRP